MSLKVFCKDIPSFLVLTTCGVISFSAGFAAYQDKDFSDPLKDILKWAVPVHKIQVPYIDNAGLFAASVVLGSIVLASKAKAVEDDLVSKAKAVEDDLVSKIKAVEDDLASKERTLSELEISASNLHIQLIDACKKLSREEAEKILSTAKNIQAISGRFKRSIDEKNRVGIWFNKDEYKNMKEVFDYSLESIQLHNLNHQQQEAFKADMNRCIHWIYFSFIDKDYPITKEQHASASLFILNAYELYKQAIESAVNFIEKGLAEEGIALNCLTLERRANTLLEGIDGIIKKNASSCNLVVK